MDAGSGQGAGMDAGSGQGAGMDAGSGQTAGQGQGRLRSCLFCVLDLTLGWTCSVVKDLLSMSEALCSIPTLKGWGTGPKLTLGTPPHRPSTSETEICELKTNLDYRESSKSAWPP